MSSPGREVGRLRIGELVRRTGVTKATVHHYVREGLLPAPTKSAPNTALYDASCVERVLLIKALQTEHRRSLAEVKGLLDRAANPRALARLELVATHKPALELDLPGEDLGKEKLALRTGFSSGELERFEAAGLLSPRGSGSRRVYRPVDVAVADALAGLLRAGFDTAHGFRPSDAAIYVEALRELLRSELALFADRMTPEEPLAETFARAERGIEAVTPLLVALRRKLLVELVAAAPRPPSDGPAGSSLGIEQSFNED